MNITIVRESFLETLQKAGYFISNKISDLKIFKSVLITAKQEGISLQTTNINEYFSGVIGGKVLKTGEVLVDYKTLSEIVKNLNDVKITLEKKDKQLFIISKSGQIKLAVLEAAAFPKEEPPQKTNPLALDYFQEKVLAPVLLGCATDEARPILTGICFDYQGKETRIVGTDGFRMSVYFFKNKSEEQERKIILSGKSLTAILRIYKSSLKQVDFGEKEKRVYFRGDGITVSTKVLEGEFPPYEKVIPQTHETRVVVKKSDLLEAIKGTSLFAKEGSNMVNIEVKNSQMIVMSVGASLGEAIFNLETLEKEGKDNKIVFNYRYLLEYLNTTTGDEVEMEMVSPFAPGVFRTKNNSDHIHVIMPIRSQE